MYLGDVNENITSLSNTKFEPYNYINPVSQSSNPALKIINLLISPQKSRKEMENEKKVAKQSSDVIWDCESSLYDSFELKAFQKHLDYAISSRTLSMPHLSGRRHPPPPPLNKRLPSKISRSFRKLIRSIFRPKSSRITNKDDNFGGEFRYEGSKEGFYMVYDALSTIPEVQEVSPEIRSQVKRSVSERFTAPSWIQ